MLSRVHPSTKKSIWRKVSRRQTRLTISWSRASPEHCAFLLTVTLKYSTATDRGHKVNFRFTKESHLRCGLCLTTWRANSNDPVYTRRRSKPFIRRAEPSRGSDKISRFPIRRIKLSSCLDTNSNIPWKEITIHRLHTSIRRSFEALSGASTELSTTFCGEAFEIKIRSLASLGSRTRIRFVPLQGTWESWSNYETS